MRELRRCDHSLMCAERRDRAILSNRADGDTELSGFGEHVAHVRMMSRRDHLVDDAVAVPIDEIAEGAGGMAISSAVLDPQRKIDSLSGVAVKGAVNLGRSQIV